jgi:hypothetical protein
MRFATSVVALLAVALLVVALLATRSTVTAPKPDHAGDAAFVTQLKQLCSKLPALVPIDASAGMAAITAAANSDNTTANDLDAGLAKLTRTISSASPLAPPATDLAQMLVDMSKWYVLTVTAAKAHDTSSLSWMPQLAVARATQARGDLAKIGVSGCLN